MSVDRKKWQWTFSAFGSNLVELVRILPLYLYQLYRRCPNNGPYRLTRQPLMLFYSISEPSILYDPPIYGFVVVDRHMLGLLYEVNGIVYVTE